MIKKKNIILGLGILLIVSFSSLNFALALDYTTACYSEPELDLDYNPTWFTSVDNRMKIKVQDKLLFADNTENNPQGFAISLRGKMDDYSRGYSQAMMTVYIYASIHMIGWDFNEPRPYPIDEWRPIPENFLIWDGDMKYNLAVDQVTTWTLGASVEGGEDPKYGFSASISGTSAADISYKSQYVVESGIWTRLGYVKSEYKNFWGSPDHDFGAMLQLTTSNNMVKDLCQNYRWVGDRYYKYDALKIKIYCSFIADEAGIAGTQIFGDNLGPQDGIIEIEEGFAPILI